MIYVKTSTTTITKTTCSQAALGELELNGAVLCLMPRTCRFLRVWTKTVVLRPAALALSGLTGALYALEGAHELLGRSACAPDPGLVRLAAAAFVGEARSSRSLATNFDMYRLVFPSYPLVFPSYRVRSGGFFSFSMNRNDTEAVMKKRSERLQ